jgi:hypothetical protein
MIETITDCPQNLELVLYASDEQSTDKHEAIYLHLQSCRDCRYRLEWCHKALSSMNGPEM